MLANINWPGEAGQARPATGLKHIKARGWEKAAGKGQTDGQGRFQQSVCLMGLVLEPGEESQQILGGNWRKRPSLPGLLGVRPSTALLLPTSTLPCSGGSRLEGDSVQASVSFL